MYIHLTYQIFRDKISDYRNISTENKYNLQAKIFFN